MTSAVALWVFNTWVRSFLFLAMLIGWTVELLWTCFFPLEHILNPQPFLRSFLRHRKERIVPGSQNWHDILHIIIWSTPEKKTSGDNILFFYCWALTEYFRWTKAISCMRSRPNCSSITLTCICSELWCERRVRVPILYFRINRKKASKSVLPDVFCSSRTADYCFYN